MKNVFRLLLCALAFFSVAAQATDYPVRSAENYLGKLDYTSCTTAPTTPCANYTLSQGFSGSFSVNAVLPPDLNGAEITGLLTAFSFNDGINTYASTDPTVRVYAAFVVTNASGTVTGLEMLFEKWLSGTSPHVATDRLSYVLFITGVTGAINSKIPNTLRKPVPGVAQGAPASGFVEAWNNVSCISAGPSEINAVADACTAVNNDSSTSIAFGAVSGLSIPTLSEWGMVTLSILLLGGAFVAMRRRESEGH